MSAMDRRDFMRVAGLGVAAHAIPGCGGSGGSSGGREPGWDSYDLLVNSPPIGRSPYFGDSALENAFGSLVEFVDYESSPDFRIYARPTSSRAYSYMAGELVDDLDGRTVATFMPMRTGTISGSSASAASSNPGLVPYVEEFLPAITKVLPSNDGNHPGGTSFGVPMLELNDNINTIAIRSEIDFSPEFFIRAYKNYREVMPQYDTLAEGKTPKGMVYAGEWGFGTIDRLNAASNKLAGITALFDPTGFSAGVYSITGTAGKTLDQIGNLWDRLNYYQERFGLPPIPFDKDDEFSVYFPVQEVGNALPQLRGPLTFISAKQRARGNENITDLLPFRTGSTWEYTGDRDLEVRVRDSFERIKGEDVIALDEGGVTEFFGMKGNTMHHYGFEEPSVGKVLFDPPIPLGNDEIREGIRFDNGDRGSRILSQRFGNRLEGTISSSFSYGPRVTADISTGFTKDRFGDCMRMEERSEVFLKNTQTGQESRDDVRSISLLAPNVGPVKRSVGAETIELKSFRRRLSSVGTAMAARSSGSPIELENARELSRRMIYNMNVNLSLR